MPFALSALQCKQLLLAGASVLISVAFAEVALRVVLGEKTLGWQSIDPVETRVEQASAAKPEGLRILGLGDSFTEFMQGVGFNWVGFTEETLREGGHDVHGINLGQMGTGPRHYLKMLSTYGKQLQPDWLVVGLYLGNDILDYEIDVWREAKGDPSPAPIEIHGRRKRGMLKSIQQSSALLLTATNVLRRALPRDNTTFDGNLAHLIELYDVPNANVEAAKSRVGPEIIELARTDAINSWDLAWGMIQPKRYHDLLMQTEGSDSPDGTQRFLTDVGQLQQDCQGLGAKCLFLIIPTGLQVHARYHEYFRKVGFTTSEIMLEPTPLVQRIEAYMQEHDIAWVNPTPALRQASESMYLPMDTHWSVEAQRIAGKMVAEHIAATLGK